MTTIASTEVLLIALALIPVSCGRPSRGGGAGDTGPAITTAAATAAPRPRPGAAPGELLVDIEESRASAAMVKDRDAAHPVLGTVLLRDGRISLGGPSPSARLSVDLLTFDSKIPLRNERVKKFLFETSSLGWDTLEFTIPHLPDAALASLRDTKRASHVKVDGEIKVHGGTSKLTATVDAYYESDGALTIKTSAPFDLKISDLGLADNLRRLSSICMHDSIDDVVKVEISLRFPPG